MKKFAKIEITNKSSAQPPFSTIFWYFYSKRARNASKCNL